MVHMCDRSKQDGHHGNNNSNSASVLVFETLKKTKNKVTFGFRTSSIMTLSDLLRFGKKYVAGAALLFWRRQEH